MLDHVNFSAMASPRSRWIRPRMILDSALVRNGFRVIGDGCVALSGKDMMVT